MGDYTCYLVTLIYHKKSLLRVALKIKNDLLSKNPTAEELYEFLPINAKYPIVEIAEIFELAERSGEK